VGPPGVERKGPSALQHRPAYRLGQRVGMDIVDPKARRAGRAGNEAGLHRERDPHVERKPLLPGKVGERDSSLGSR
jgi:hypothetical protein